MADYKRKAKGGVFNGMARANQNSPAKIGRNIKVGGKRPKGQPKQRLLDTLDGDLKATREQPAQAFDKIKWRN